ncbi:sensor histidine kinase [Neobacillus terrae]|uniref:sensor histidine kinase n=1 Tax=Neobacillus terrae TaxID=3034837 RepID=UPI00140E1884|nr:sensor histidine kinase [Neobacillus terrae]NHM31260.1 sensor histidine kinase [Neobacillus terrae]
MFKRYWFLLKNTGISPYIWTILGILPFYFIFQQPSTLESVIGIFLTLLFFVFYRFAFISKGWPVYLWTILLIAISITLTALFSYIYFAFFLAYFIGNIKNKIPFLTLYIIHLVGMSAVINFQFALRQELFIKQVPFVIIVWISIILLPFTLRYHKERGKLEEKLEDANKRISELVKQEERQRIARDLHDTLGQKLSLIGLKSDLARRLVYKDPEKAREELADVQQTARTALNEVRKMVSEMRGIRLKDEIVMVKQILKAAQIELVIDEEFSLSNVSLLTENILSMCLKEAVTNVVKHSGATVCTVIFEQTDSKTVMSVHDNGLAGNEINFSNGSGLAGMRERLEFVNGSLDIKVDQGTTLFIKVPNMVRLFKGEESI